MKIVLITQIKNNLMINYFLIKNENIIYCTFFTSFNYQMSKKRIIKYESHRSRRKRTFTRKNK